MQPAEARIAELLDAAGVADVSVTTEPFGMVVRVRAAAVEEALATLWHADYEMLVDMFAADTGEQIALTYHVRRLEDMHELYVRATVDYDGEAPSVWRVYPAALYPEREAAELFGVSFAAHPNPKRLLTTDEVEGYLLRKATPVRSEEEVTLRGRV